jgi:hypothetical protein
MGMLDPAQHHRDPIGDLRQQLGAARGELGLVELLGGERGGEERPRS